jgi:hypothetical protein
MVGDGVALKNPPVGKTIRVLVIFKTRIEKNLPRSAGI